MARGQRRGRNDIDIARGQNREFENQNVARAQYSGRNDRTAAQGQSSARSNQNVAPSQTLGHTGKHAGAHASHSRSAAVQTTQYSRNDYANKAQNRRKARGWKVVLIISIVVLVCALGALGAIGFSYWQGQQAYNRISQSADLDTSKGDIDLNSTQVDWDSLKAINPDIVAWIYIPNTNINYPVVKGDDDYYYLTHDFEGSSGGITTNGCIFMHYENKSNLSDTGVFIFGHHLNDGTMFSALSDEGSFTNHRTVYLFTPTVNMKLKAFSLVHCSASDPLLQIKFSSSSSLREYLTDIIDRSVVQVDDAPDVSEIDQFFAFSTCDNQFMTNGRYVMFCAVDEVGSAS